MGGEVEYLSSVAALCNYKTTRTRVTNAATETQRSLIRHLDPLLSPYRVHGFRAFAIYVFHAHICHMNI